MAEPRRRLSPDDRRGELLALGAEVFGQRPYDEVRIDEIAERAGVSRALMYHYFPDKRAFFAAVVRAEGERLFEATNAPPDPDQSLFDQLRSGCNGVSALRRRASARRLGRLHGHGPLRSGAARHRGHRQRSPGQSDPGADQRGRRRTNWTPRSSAICGSPSTAGWPLPSKCAASGSWTRRSMPDMWPTPAPTCCSTPSAGCPACPPSWSKPSRAAGD